MSISTCVMGRGYQDLHELQMAMHKARGGRTKKTPRAKKPRTKTKREARVDRGDAARYVLDTNTLLYLIENPHFRSMLSIRLDVGDSNVYMSSTIRQELQKHGYTQAAADCIRNHLKANVVPFAPTAEDRAEAPRLEGLYGTLHWPDSMILAETAARAATLVTRDRGLAAAAKEHGVPVVNPDLLCT